MKCPSYIKNKIIQRAKYAEKFLQLDGEIADWMTQQRIDSEYSLSGYVEALCGTYSAAEECIKDIENA